MIAVTHTIADYQELASILEKSIRRHLTSDVSNYARGRLRAWLKIEPSLVPPIVLRPAVPIPDLIWNGLKDLIQWDFDYCLVTYSGDSKPIGILPHRDASYADYEAVGLNVIGTCEFKYWMGRESYDSSPDLHGYNPVKDEPTHTLNLEPGQVVKFNCKNLHQAIPSSNRWNMNFWKANPKRKIVTG